METGERYLGRGLKSPLTINSLGRTVLVGGAEKVAQSLVRLLSTPLGTRFMVPEYGTRLEELIFEPSDQVLESYARTFISEAIDKWEKRVRYIDCDFEFDPDNAFVSINVMYKNLQSNEIESFVYPFYRKLKY